MSNQNSIIVFNNIKLPFDASVQEAFSVAKKKLRAMGLSSNAGTPYVYKRSIDARNKKSIQFVYSIAVDCNKNSITAEMLVKYGAVLVSNTKNEFTTGEKALTAPPVIVGSGPAGMYAGLVLAEMGYAPIILERGSCIKERVASVRRFNETHTLDKDTNIQFGAGGAGTFSDGKLVTRTNDPLSSYVLERLVEFGAQEEIRYIAKPHVGTDVLAKVVDNILARIEDLGGKVMYNTRMTDFECSGGRVTAVVTDKGRLEAGALILAIGHSARDTYQMLLRKNVSIESKDFSVGMRIEHLANDIDKSLFGDFAGHPLLGHAEYNLSHNTKIRGVYTFCMCPGGEVVAATSEEYGTVVNGMSYSKRDGVNSNCAVVCSVFKNDYGATPEKAIEFQRNIERGAFTAAGGDYKAPIITVGDFLNGECKTAPTSVVPTYMNGNNVALASPDKYLPSFVAESIKTALSAFDNKINGFARKEAILTGAETRTSAPVRILRNNETKLALGFENLYPSGEGAGYAGGITSAAIDGLKCAIALMSEFKPIIRR
jgi:uncharacterized FAD-dependent dehydrogenase